MNNADQIGPHEHNLKRKRSDEDATGDKDHFNSEKFAKDGKTHSFGPLK